MLSHLLRPHPESQSTPRSVLEQTHRKSTMFTGFTSAIYHSNSGFGPIMDELDPLQSRLFRPALTGNRMVQKHL